MEGSVTAGLGRIVNGDQAQSTVDYRAAIHPMFSYNPIPKWAFLAKIGELSVQDRVDYISTNRVQLDLGRVSLGVNYFLSRRATPAI